MSKDKINIPVEVTGDEAAKNALGEVAGSVESVGAAGQSSASGLGAAGSAGEVAGKGVDQAGQAATKSKPALDGIGAAATAAGKATKEAGTQAAASANDLDFLGLQTGRAARDFDFLGVNARKATTAQREAAPATKQLGSATRDASTQAAAAAKNFDFLGVYVGKADAAVRKSAGAQGDAANAAKKLGERTGDVNASAKAFASGLAGQVNPQMGAMINLISDGVEGIGKMSIGLLAIGGGAVAVGGLVAIFQHLAEEARKAEERIQKVRESQKALRDEALALQGNVADALKGAGIAGVADVAKADAAGLNTQGIERDLAVFGATARQVGRGKGDQRRALTDDEVRDVIAGFLAGGEQAQFGRDQAANQRVITDLLQTGGTPESRAFLEARKRDVRDRVGREQVPSAALDPEKQRMDTTVENFKRQLNLSDEDAKRIRRLASGEGLADVFKDRIDFFEKQFSIGVPGRDPGGGSRARVLGSIGDEFAEGTTRPVASLARIAAHVRNQAQSGAAGQEPAGAVTIHVHDNSQKVEAGQWFSARVDEAFPKPAPDYAGFGVD